MNQPDEIVSELQSNRSKDRCKAMYRLIAADDFPSPLARPFLNCLEVMRHDLRTGSFTAEDRKQIEIALTFGAMILQRVLTQRESTLDAATQEEAEAVLLKLCAAENKKVAYAAVHWLGRMRHRGRFGVEVLQSLAAQHEDLEAGAVITIRGAALRALLAIGKDAISVNRWLLATDELRNALVHWISIAKSKACQHELLSELAHLDSLRQ